MKLFSLRIVFACMPLAGQQSVSLDASSEVRESIPAFSASGPITLPALHVHLNIGYQRGKEEVADLTVIYDPLTRHYLWFHGTLGSSTDIATFMNAITSGRVAIYSDEAGMVDFEFPYGIGIKTSALTANSLDGVRAASITHIRQGLAAFKGGGYYETLSKSVDLRTVLSHEFRCAPLHADCPNRNTIVSIENQSTNWRLVLRNRWDQEIILDPKFTLVSAQQLTQPK